MCASVAPTGSTMFLAGPRECRSAFSAFLSLASVLSRLVREGKLSNPQRDVAKSRALRDIADADVCQLTPAVISTAVYVVEEHPVRALDALHVASALEIRSDLFVSADARQLTAARLCGLRTLDLAN
jgi:predicted nucleic acid-binding protein